MDVMPALCRSFPAKRHFHLTSHSRHSGFMQLRSSSSLGATWLQWVLLAMAALPAMALSQTPSPLPPNSHARDYGTGWDCNHGYRQDNRTCVRVQVPQNGYLDASGN